MRHNAASKVDKTPRDLSMEERANRRNGLVHGPNCGEGLVASHAGNRRFTSRSSESDPGLNWPVRSISTLNVTGTWDWLQDRT